MKAIIFTLILCIAGCWACFAQNDITGVGRISGKTEPGTYTHADTVRAVKHLYERKRKGGKTRAIVFGILGTVALINALTYEPDYVIINQGSSGSQRVSSGGPEPAGYILIGFSTIMTITGITQRAKYSYANLHTVLEEYEQGHLSPQIKSKLKKKDFK